VDAGFGKKIVQKRDLKRDLIQSNQITLYAAAQQDEIFGLSATAPFTRRIFPP